MSDLISRISRLNEEQRQILEARLKEQNLNLDTLAGDTELSADSRDNPEDGCGYYPVSAVQQSMYLLNRLIGTDSCYNEPFAVMVEGILNIEKLETACSRLVQRHEALRTSFHSEHGKPVQKIHRTAAVRILMVDSYTGSMDDLILNFIQPFDLASLPLLRLMCIRLADNKHILVFDMPHIITDWESSGIFVQDLFSLYNSRPVPVQTSQNRDFALFQLELEKSELWQIQEKYWQDIYVQNIPELLLPYDFPRPPVQSFEGASVHIQLNDEIKFRLRSLCADAAVTLNTVFIACFYTLLHKYSGLEDIVIGQPVSLREPDRFRDCFGMLINTLPLRNFPKSESTFIDFLKELQNNLSMAYQHRHYPFEKIVEKSAVDRDLNSNPLFDVMFNFYNIDNIVLKTDEFRVSPFKIETNRTKVDLIMTVRDSVKHTGITLEYCTKLFRRNTIERMLIHYLNILNSVTANHFIRLKELDILSGEEKRELIYGFNNTAAEYERNVTLQEIFERTAVANASKTALIFDKVQMTYREVNEQSNRLAHKLIKLGVKPDTIVGIMTDRNQYTIIGIFGILKAGGAYLPISPQLPENRINFITAESGFSILLTEKQYGHKVQSDITRINLDENSVYDDEPTNPGKTSSSSNLAYVLYTSGSTGNPKGVMIEHRSLVNRINWLQKKFSFNENDVVFFKTPYTFDVSVEEIFWWTFCGAKVCILPTGQEMDPEKIVAAIDKFSVSSVRFVPSMLNIFLLYVETNKVQDKLKSLKVVFSSGEALHPTLVNRFNALKLGKALSLYNFYGPTEATIDVSFFQCPPDEYMESVPIGKPIDNTRFYVMNRHLQLQPVGINGELYIAGDNVGRGYLNNPELTESRFLQDPHFPEGRMYKTGDIVKWAEDGNVLYLGRVDNQVKIRGHRIELEEIEYQLLKYDKIDKAAVVIREDKSGEKYLHACVVSKIALIRNDIREYLSGVLPEYMIPAFISQIPVMPLKDNGKIDKGSLPGPDYDVLSGKKTIHPQNANEAKLAQIWKKVLKLKDIGITDNFFEVGGHSLRANILVFQIYKEYGIQIPLMSVFNYPTIMSMARFLEKQTPHEYKPIPKIPEKEYYEVSASQRRMFLLSELKGHDTSDNVVHVFLLHGELDIRNWEAALIRLIERHEVFRTSFRFIEEQLVQVVAASVDFKLNVIDAPESEIDWVINRLILPFDLACPPLIQCTLVRTGDTRHFLIINTHHIITDGSSIAIFMNELIDLYSGRDLPELKIQFRDFAAWHNRLLKSEEIVKQRDYWLRLFSEDVPVPDLPVDFPRPAVLSFNGDYITDQLGREILRKLKIICQDIGITLFNMLLGIYSILLSQYSSREDIVIGIPAAGRNHPDLENSIGMFINTLALRLLPARSKTASGYLKEVHECLLQALKHQDYQFDQLIIDLGIKRDPSRTPLFNTMFVLQNAEWVERELENIEMKEYPVRGNVTQFEIMFHAFEIDDDIYFKVLYSTDLFKKDTLRELCGNFRNLAQLIINSQEILLGDINVFPGNGKPAKPVIDKEDISFNF